MSPADELNEELMRSIGARLGEQPFVDTVRKFPLEKPDRVVATFQESFYPDPVSTAWLELRIRLNDDLNVIYVEDWGGERWLCRWDRHENDHNAREHFHPPPAVTSQTAVDIDLPREPHRAVLTAFEFIEERIQDLWQTAEVTYPSEYEFGYEYGPDIWA